jgi:hypothetical protein
VFDALEEPSETCGVVAGVAPAGEVEVHFVNGRVELVEAERLRAHTTARNA